MVSYFSCDMYVLKIKIVGLLSHAQNFFDFVTFYEFASFAHHLCMLLLPNLSFCLATISCYRVCMYVCSYVFIQYHSI